MLWLVRHLGEPLLVCRLERIRSRVLNVKVSQARAASTHHVSLEKIFLVADSVATEVILSARRSRGYQVRSSGYKLGGTRSLGALARFNVNCLVLLRVPALDLLQNFDVPRRRGVERPVVVQRRRPRATHRCPALLRQYHASFVAIVEVHSRA